MMLQPTNFAFDQLCGLKIFFFFKIWSKMTTHFYVTKGPFSNYTSDIILKTYLYFTIHNKFHFTSLIKCNKMYVSNNVVTPYHHPPHCHVMEGRSCLKVTVRPETIALTSTLTGTPWRPQILEAGVYASRPAWTRGRFVMNTGETSGVWFLLIIHHSWLHNQPQHSRSRYTSSSNTVPCE